MRLVFKELVNTFFWNVISIFLLLNFISILLSQHYSVWFSILTYWIVYLTKHNHERSTNTFKSFVGSLTHSFLQLITFPCISSAYYPFCMFLLTKESAYISVLIPVSILGQSLLAECYQHEPPVQEKITWRSENKKYLFQLLTIW